MCPPGHAASDNVATGLGPWVLQPWRVRTLALCPTNHVAGCHREESPTGTILKLLSHAWPLFARKALRYNDSSRSFMSPLLFPSMLLLLPSLPWEAFYKVFIRGRVWWDFERKNWNQREEQPAECEDWNPWKWEAVQLSHATKNNSSKRHFTSTATTKRAQ